MYLLFKFLENEKKVSKYIIDIKRQKMVKDLGYITLRLKIDERQEKEAENGKT